MATIIVTSQAGLEAALSSVKAGDTITLAGGNYAEFSLRGKTFDTPVNIVAADPKNPPVFESVYLYKVQGVHFTDVNVKFTPTETTLAHSSAVKIALSSDISFKGGEVEGGPSVNGVPPESENLDSTGNVLGWPAARGFTIDNSTGVTVENVEIHYFHKGLVLSKSSDLVIRGNEIYDLRTSPITGGGLNNVVIDGNHLHDSNPWRWGKGDHGDFIHIWTSESIGQSKNFVITNNVIEQGDGEALLGIYLDDNGRGIGFDNVEISNNLIMNGDHQGISLENVSNGKVIDNALLQSSGTFREAPGMLFTQGSHDIVVSGNFAKFISPNDTTSNIRITDNTLIQSDSAFSAGYYTREVLETLADMSPSEAYAYFSKLIAAWTPVNVATLSIQKTSYQTLDTDVGMKVSASGSLDQLVVGGRGNDTVVGGYGNDTLVGGAGDDFLSGSRGHDVLQGGAGADIFNLAQDYPINGGFDLIVDFSRAEGDRIKVHSIDANIHTSGNDSFTLIGTQAFHKVAGELRYTVVDGNSIVEGDVDGDGVADFSLKVMGVTDLIASDFIGVLADGKSAPAAPIENDLKAVVAKLGAPLETVEDLRISAKGSAGQFLVGGKGNDTITGLHGDDTLVGGAGNDYLSGSRGNDVMQGGEGADIFNFAGDYATVGGFDTITDFSHAEGDIIRLHSMDANTLTSGNDAFTFIGTEGFHKTAGELRYSIEKGNAIVQGDLDGDGVADFSILVVGVGTLVAEDFAL